ncbi:MAG: hypothetical protein ABR615_04450 [Pseudonocardiaceae bacterium]
MGTADSGSGIGPSTRTAAPVDRAGGHDLPPEQAGNQEPRHHEEDVDVDEPTGQARNRSVVQDNGQHGDCTPL